MAFKRLSVGTVFKRDAITIHYSATILHNIGFYCQIVKLSAAEWNEVLHLRLSRHGQHNTKRGCRAGAHKTRTIETIVLARQANGVFTQTSGACLSNIRQLHMTPIDENPVRPVSFCLLDARSVCDVRKVGKATMICELMEDNDLDVLAITETWLTPDDSVSAGCITPATC